MKEYTVWNPDQGETKEDGRVIQARDAIKACELWAERDDYESAEYSIVGGEDVILMVEMGDGSIRSAHVTGEAVPTYYALVDDDEEDRQP